MYYETVFETGRNSVVSAESDEEALRGAREQHARAMRGERSLLSEPNSPPAERVVKLLAYEEHPNDWNVAQTLSSEVLEKEVKQLIKALADDNGVVAVDRFAVEVRGLTHPVVASAGPHDSIFKMKEVREIALGTYDAEKGTWS